MRSFIPIQTTGGVLVSRHFVPSTVVIVIVAWIWDQEVSRRLGGKIVVVLLSEVQRGVVLGGERGAGDVLTPLADTKGLDHHILLGATRLKLEMAFRWVGLAIATADLKIC